MHRQLKDPVYDQFARVGHAIASPKRIELLDLLTQGEKPVELLAEQASTPVKNTSAHLRVLRQACLVETRRSGTHVYYRIADDDVVRLLQALQSVARTRLAEVERVARMYLTDRDALEPVSLKELRRLLREDEVVLLDVRPRDEYEAGHIPGALSLPLSDLPRRIGELPQKGEVIAYCRGAYCVYSLEAVTALRSRGYRARRVEEGFADWRAAGWPVARGPETGVPRGRSRRQSR